MTAQVHALRPAAASPAVRKSLLAMLERDLPPDPLGRKLIAEHTKALAVLPDLRARLGHLAWAADNHGRQGWVHEAMAMLHPAATHHAAVARMHRDLQVILNAWATELGTLELARAG